MLSDLDLSLPNISEDQLDVPDLSKLGTKNYSTKPTQSSGQALDGE